MSPHTEPKSHPDLLANLLLRCTVRISSNGRLGTGFFVAPGYILTCAHVVGQSHAAHQKIPFSWDGRDYSAFLERLDPDPCPVDDIFPDIAILSTALHDTPYVHLVAGYKDSDPFYSFGYSGLRPGGESLSADCEGVARYDPMLPDTHLIKFKGTQVLPGISGSPVLNRNTNGVCGIIKRTRGDGGDLGGLAVRIELAIPHLKEVIESGLPDIHSQWLYAIRSKTGATGDKRPAFPSWLRSAVGCYLVVDILGIWTPDPFRGMAFNAGIGIASAAVTTWAASRMFKSRPLVDRRLILVLSSGSLVIPYLVPLLVWSPVSPWPLVGYTLRIPYTAGHWLSGGIECLTFMVLSLSLLRLASRQRCIPYPDDEKQSHGLG